MNLIESVKKISGNWALKQVVQNINPEPEHITFKEAIKIGIIYYIKHEDEMTPIGDFIRFLQDQKKAVYIIGATTGFPIPKSKITNLNFIQLKEDELKWNGVPDSYRIKSFLENDFDLMIDFTQEEYFPLRYILLAAHSKIRIGRYDLKTAKNYHFMIDTWQKPDIFNLTEQVNHYLTALS
jgi:hypothetical protein